ncbi:hypothetical protein CRG98_019621 [Punica granatum]|uniref:Uncharacterized protein n=1 Tax=Punica granatum TaxID=22663 RepID=A0A2I0JUJ6_PUNGR|nr:hypothetical protein CRG98_019621 [Punica granatum]
MLGRSPWKAVKLLGRNPWKPVASHGAGGADCSVRSRRHACATPGVICCGLSGSRVALSPIGPFTRLEVAICCMSQSRVRQGGDAPWGPDARPPRLLLGLHGHIEMFSKVPKRLYRLFDAPVNLGPFSSGCRRAAAFVTRMGNFIQFWAYRCMLSVMGLYSGEGPICPEVPLDLDGDACFEVDRFVRLSLSLASSGWRVGRDHSSVGDVTVLVTFAAGGQGHALFVGAVACDLLRLKD